MRDIYIFDFDGTLADSIALGFRVYNSMAPTFGTLPVEKSEIAGLRALGYTKALKAKRIRWSKLPRMVMKISREMRAHMDEVKPYDGIVETLSELKKRGITLGILTSNQEATVREFLAAHHFPAFDFVVSEKTLFGKDKALKKIIRKYGFIKEKVIYIGDEPRDVAASKRLGLPVVGVTWGLAGEAGLAQDPPTVLIHHPRELLTLGTMEV